MYVGYMDRLEYRVEISAGANPSQIIMETGASKVELKKDGSLEATLSGAYIRMSRPMAWQEIEGKKVEVNVVFLPLNNGKYSFKIGDYDREYPLIIDPVIKWSTFIGGDGGGEERAYGIAIDSTGAAYVTGNTSSVNFPTTVGSMDETYNGNNDVFVTKISPDGTTLVYSTFLGGNEDDYGQGIAVDSSGFAYVTGYTHSSDFPTTSGAWDESLNHASFDCFVVKLSPDGSHLVYSTYLGGSRSDNAFGIAVDSGGRVYVVGQTTSLDFPVTAGAYSSTPNSYYDLFVTKFSTSGDSLIYSTYIGGSSIEDCLDLSVDSLGAVYMTGWTKSDDFPTTTSAWDKTLDGQQDAFVLKLSADGSSLVYSTYLGGASADYGQAISVDKNGSAYVTGYTESDDFPTTTACFDNESSGDNDAFVTKISADGSTLTYSTYLGGAHDDVGYGIAVDAVGSAYVTGYTFSYDFPTTSGVWSENYNLGDIFVTKLSPDGSSIQYSTYIGGGSVDFARDIKVDSNGAVYVTGDTLSRDFPITPGALDRHYHGERDVFVTKLSNDGSALDYSTFLGGSGGERDSFIAIGKNGYIYLAGKSGSPDYPTTTGVWSENKNINYDVVVSVLAADGTSLVYSTFIGGEGQEEVGGIAVDSSGAAYITGNTYSNDFPTTSGAFDTSYNGKIDCYITEVSADGSSLEYSTFLGGENYDYGKGISVNTNGEAYVVGNTISANFPTTSGVWSEVSIGGYDLFVSKLSSDGSSLVYSTYIGGSRADFCSEIVIDSAGDSYISGHTYSSDFPTTTGAYSEVNSGSYDAFVMKLSNDGKTINYSTYIGGTLGDFCYGMAVDSNGETYIIGYTNSTDFPTSPQCFADTLKGYNDVFVSKLSADGSSLLYSTYIGGTGGEYVKSIVLDSNNSAYITGYTYSDDYPITPGALCQKYGGNSVYITKISPDGSSLEYSSYVKDSIVSYGTDLAINEVGNVFLTGFTSSTIFPTTQGAFDESPNGGYDFYVMKLVFPEFTYYFPRMSYAPDISTEGYGFMNILTYPVDIWFALFDSDGTLLSISDVYSLDGGKQFAYQAEGIFSCSGTPREGWVEAETTNDDPALVPGYFLTQSFNNGGLTGLDGNSVFYESSTGGVIPRVSASNGYSTEVFMANTGQDDTNVTLTAYDGTTSYDGGVITIPAMGYTKFDVSTQFGASFNGYIELLSTSNIVANATIAHGTDGIASVNLIPYNEGAKTLYGAHITVMPDLYYTELNLVNMSDADNTVTISPYNADGTAMAVPFTVHIPAKQVKVLRNEEIGLPATGTADGWVKIEGEQELVGCVTFGNPVDNHYESTLPLGKDSGSNIGFVQVANGNVAGVDFFTGLAIVNPNTTSVDVTIKIITSDGSVVGQVTRTLAAGEKYVRIIDQIEGMGTLPGMSSGMIRVTATNGVFAFELFGDNDLNFLSAVPGAYFL